MRRGRAERAESWDGAGGERDESRDGATQADHLSVPLLPTTGL